MDPQDRLAQLKKQKEELLAERDRLVGELKDRHPDFYHWMVEKKVHPNDLGKYLLNIGAAFTFAYGAVVPASLSVDQREMIDSLIASNQRTEQAIPPVKIIQPAEMAGMKEEEKAALVWERYRHLINRAAVKYQLDPKLIMATIMLESGGDTYAIRHEPQIGDASYGLGQILYGTARGIGFDGPPDKLFDPEVNIDLIGKYHRRNMDTYGGNLTAEQLTVAYNTGTPYGQPYFGHMTKFKRLFELINNLVV
jgi:soluble lytic murein transglycosylase-like protein